LIILLEEDLRFQILDFVLRTQSEGLQI
jgi:hypothetical protein